MCKSHLCKTSFLVYTLAVSRAKCGGRRRRSTVRRYVHPVSCTSDSCSQHSSPPKNGLKLFHEVSYVMYEHILRASDLPAEKNAFSTSRVHVPSYEQNEPSANTHTKVPGKTLIERHVVARAYFAIFIYGYAQSSDHRLPDKKYK